MTKERKIFIILILLTINSLTFAQQDILATHYNQFDVNIKKESYKMHANYSNEAQQLASLFFLFYKEFISSQDMNMCVFSPSCSVYTMESIKSKGVLLGIISGFDRLSRCHPMAQKYYSMDPVTNKLYDPVKEK
jgi:putative component of membrane protein insertase Oxa1/YidC/SpoIIIJ protein YidD